jgi:LruC domain-containing protein
MKSLMKLMAVVAILAAFSACRKHFEEMPADTVNKMTDLKVPVTFDWKTTRDLQLTVSLPGDGIYPMQSRLDVYLSNPLLGGELLLSGSLNQGQPFERMVRVPSYLKSLHLMLETSTGSKHFTEIPINGNIITYTFSGQKAGFSLKSAESATNVGPECDTCNQVISGNGSVTITGGQTYCVTESFSGTVNFQTWSGGGTLKVCGNATLSGTTTLGTNSHIIVTQNGTLSMNALSMWGNSATVSVYSNASLTVNNGFSTVGTFLNYGQMIVNGSLTVQQLNNPFVNNGSIQVTNGNFQLNNATMQQSGSLTVSGTVKLNSNSSMTNSGTLTSGGHFEINGSQLVNTNTITVAQSHFSINGGSSFTNNGSVDLTTGNFNVNSNNLLNNGSITAGGRISFNSGSGVVNNCMMSCQGLAEFNSGNIVFDNGYLRSETKIQINSGANTVLKNGSMLSTTNFELYANIIGQQATNSIKAETEFKMSSQTVSGPVELATDNLNILPGTPVSQHFINGAVVVALGNEQNFLPITACNPEGVGSIIINDTDNDGVPDDLDDFPNDPDRAYRSWYPGQNTFSTIAFEDLWPGLGDFDFNDVVVEFQYELITNAANQLVDLNGRFRLMAAGASLNNGFGVSIPVAPIHIGSVSGGQIDGSTILFDPNGTEAGHTANTVIIVYDAINTTFGGGFINTIPGNTYIQTDTVTVSVTFTNPQASFGAAPFNPFIFVDQERGKEVHMLDFVPTELVNPAYFGIWEDRSVPSAGAYYKTESNLPWAIEIPVTFDYPIETIDILLTHLKFAEWASSGGTVFQDWYLDLPGYRNQQNIYQVPVQ